MFADSLLETSWAYRGRRSWTTLTSFGLQALVIGLLLLIPLLTTVGIPINPVVTTPVSLGAPPPPPAPRPPQSPSHPIQSNLSDNVVIAPHSIPHTVQMLNETEAPPQVSYNSDPGVIGSTGPGGSTEGVWKSLNDSMSQVQPPPPTPTPVKREFKTSSMLEGYLIRRVQPNYPPLARSARIQGPVVLTALISRSGTMANVTAVSGHPMLIPAAVQAVSQWRYRPYILNGEAIEVETQITVNFVLGQN